MSSFNNDNNNNDFNIFDNFTPEEEFDDYDGYDDDMEYAVLYRKIPLKYNFFCFVPQMIMTGITMPEKVFISDNDEEYFSVEDPSFLLSEIDTGYYYNNTAAELVNMGYSPEHGFLDYYYDKLDNEVVFGYFSGVETKIVSIPKTALLNYNNYDSDQDVSIGGNYSNGNIHYFVPQGMFDDLVESEDIDAIKAFRDQLDIIKIGIEEGVIQFEEAAEREEKHKEKQEELEEVFEEQIRKEELKVEKDKLKELYKELKKRIIGQDAAIESVLYAMYMDSKASNPRYRKRAILVGPTGSGKSEIINVIKEVYDKPLVHVDTTQNTAPGYVGANIEDDLARLIKASDGDIEKAQNGIIVFDEIDKKGGTEVVGEGRVNKVDVIDQLLKFCDGTTYQVSFDGKNINFDTSNLTIFACGAFPKVFERKGLEEGKNKIGFGAEEKKKKDKVELTPMDIAKYGNMGPEFAGRFSVLVQMNRLSKENLKEIMTSSSISPLKHHIDALKEDDITFTYDDKFLDAVAGKAYELETGGRALNSIIDKLFKDQVTKTILFDEDDEIRLFGTAENDEPVIKKEETKKVEKTKPKTLKKVVAQSRP